MQHHRTTTSRKDGTDLVPLNAVDPHEEKPAAVDTWLSCISIALHSIEHAVDAIEDAVRPDVDECASTANTLKLEAEQRLQYDLCTGAIGVCIPPGVLSYDNVKQQSNSRSYTKLDTRSRALWDSILL